MARGQDFRILLNGLLKSGITNRATLAERCGVSVSTVQRHIPAYHINKSGTRKEELLLPKDELTGVWILRKVPNPLSPVETMELLLDRLSKTRSNNEFPNSMSG